MFKGFWYIQNKIFSCALLRPFIFRSYYQIIDIWSTYPYTYSKMVVGFVYLEFREKLSLGFKYPTHPLRLGGAEIGKKRGGALRIFYFRVREFSKKRGICCKTCLEID